MKKIIKILAMLIAGFALCANAATISKSGSYWYVNGGGEITIDTGDVFTNSYFDGGPLDIGNTSSGNHLIIDGANVKVNNGTGNIYIGGVSGLNNMMELKNGATLSGGDIRIGYGSSGNRVILGENSKLTASSSFVSYAGNTLEFAGGAMSATSILYIETGSEIVVSGNYAKDETIFSWSGIHSGAGYISSANALLAKFNAAYGDGTYFGLSTGSANGANSIVVLKDVIPEPASVLMVVAVAGVVGFYRRFFCKL